jgi:hypothetical protein
MTEELDELSKARAKKEMEKLFKQYGIDESLHIHQQLVNAFSGGKCCSGKCAGHSVSSGPKIGVSDLVRMKEKRPSAGSVIILLIGGALSPMFARYTPDGYFIQGWIGITEIQEDDLWIDITELLRAKGDV